MSEVTNTGRRTQKERKAAAVEKLINATITTIIEVGYHGTSLSVICKAAGISQGGLFRHFPTRKALIIAAAGVVNDRLVNRFLLGFQNREASADVMEVVLDLLRDDMLSAEQSVWQELSVAARTDAELCTALAEHEHKMNEGIRDLADAMAPQFNLDSGELFTAILLAIRCFDGLSLINCLYDKPKEPEAIRQLLLRGAKGLKRG